MFSQTASANIPGINSLSVSISPIISPISTVSPSMPPIASVSPIPTISPITSTYNLSPTEASIFIVSASVSPPSILYPSKSPNPSASRSPIVNNNTILYNISDENALIICAIVLGAFLVNLVCSITWYRKYKLQKAKNKLPVKFPNNPLHSSVRSIFT